MSMRNGARPRGAPAARAGADADAAAAGPDGGRAGLRPAWALMLGFVAAALLAGIGLGILVASSSPSAGTGPAAALPATAGTVRLLMLGVLTATFGLMLAAVLGLWRQAARAVRAPSRRR